MAGNISAMEMASLRLTFAKLDANGDGTLTLEEMKAGAKELGIDVSDLEALFKKMDADGSGEVDYLEFADNYADFATNNLWKIFEKLDADGSGTLSLEEMRAGIDELGIDEKDLGPLFRKMDADGSGEVDYAEFVSKLLVEMAGGWVGSGARVGGGPTEEQRFAALGSSALQVYVLSLEDLPHRDSNGEDWKPQVFAVRLSWPSAPFFGVGEVTGLAAYVWGSPRRRPWKSHGTYVYVDRTARLPWVEANSFAVLAVYQTDLLSETYIGEIKLPLKMGRDSRVRRCPIIGTNRTVEGFVHLRLILPEARSRHINNLYHMPKPRLPRRRSEASTPWWSPMWLCSNAELGYAESC
mmetsp:Transcript_49335/g.159285  ORF Transcript_49335/g.159285 Transcript_49335/m.159285 type:complete len:353 (+) Transcript_49335:226-1284(+)